MPPDAETMTRISKGIRACADAMGASCTMVARFAALTDAARSAGVGPDGVIRTQEQAEAVLGLLRQWWRQTAHKKKKGHR